MRNTGDDEIDPRAISSSQSSTADGLKNDIFRHMEFTLGRDPQTPDQYACFMGLAYSIRDRLIERWIKTQRSLHDAMAKRVYFLSLEFLPGRFLMNYLLSLNMVEEARCALRELGFDLDELEEVEWDAALGNGGLGRLASCYMDSMACLKIPGYGYGIRYDYGIFRHAMESM
jgi:glycogen phosphorylase